MTRAGEMDDYKRDAIERNDASEMSGTERGNGERVDMSGANGVSDTANGAGTSKRTEVKRCASVKENANDEQRANVKGSGGESERRGLSADARAKIERQIDEMRRRLPIDSNDLDYETHLHAIRMLENILARHSRKNHQ